MHTIIKRALNRNLDVFNATFSLDFNAPISDISTAKGDKFFFPDPSPVTIPPGLPAFYGWQDIDTREYYKPGQELYPVKDSSYKGVFNVGRPITLEISNELQQYKITFTSFWHDTEVATYSEPVDDIPETIEYRFSVTVPQLEQLAGDDIKRYSFSLELTDSSNTASFVIPYNTDFTLETVGKYININQLSTGCRAALLYDSIEVWAEVF